MTRSHNICISVENSAKNASVLEAGKHCSSKPPALALPRCQILTSMIRERTLSELFSSRSGEYLVKDPETDELLPKQGPDRVYGLRRIVELEVVLSQNYLSANPADPAAGKPLSNVFHTSPFKETAEPLLFPFLVVEFKSEKNAVGFYDIQNQTALPISRLLQLQMDLRSAARTKASAVLHPLVWFFAFRGDDVRVYAAYTIEEGLAHKTVCRDQAPWS